MRRIASVGGLSLLVAVGGTAACASARPLRHQGGRSGGLHAFTSATHAPVLFGDQAVERKVGSARDGTAEAFPVANRKNGTARAIAVYVAKRNRARALVAGIYANAHGHPGSLLASASAASPRQAAWDTLRIKATRVHAGRIYWIAILGRHGTLLFRDRGDGRCTAVSSISPALKSLPASWRPGARRDTCPFSAHVTSVAGRSTSGTGAPAPAPAPPSPGQPASGSPPAAPAAGAFPNASNTGTVGCPPLTPSGGMTISQNNAVVQNLDISGTVIVTGNNVTLHCVRIRDNDPSGNTGYVLRLDQGDGTTVSDSEIDGQGGNQDACVMGSSYTLEADNIHGCEDDAHAGWNVTIEDSYLHDNATMDSAPHSDGIQMTGYAGWTTSYNSMFRHNTILPSSCPSDPPNFCYPNSAVFIKSDFGPISGVTVDDNLLDFGAYIVYSVSGGSGVPSDITFSNNHFGRDYHYGPHSLQGSPTWSGNVWNDTGAAVR